MAQATKSYVLSSTLEFTEFYANAQSMINARFSIGGVAAVELWIKKSYPFQIQVYPEEGTLIS